MVENVCSPTIGMPALRFGRKICLGEIILLNGRLQVGLLTEIDVPGAVSTLSSSN